MAQLPDAARLEVALTARLGLSVAALSSDTPEGPVVELWPKDLNRTNGFVVRTTLGWRHILVDCAWGTFAAPVLHQMSEADPQQKLRASAFVQLLKAQGGQVTCRLNGQQVIVEEPGTWPSWLTSVDLKVERAPLMMAHEDATEMEEVVLLWGGTTLAVLVSLLQTEEVGTDLAEPGSAGVPEGALMRVVVNRYERHKLNRMLCLEANGVACQVCGLEFGQRYGDIGEGFIHVHHTVPVSRMGPSYIVDPIGELVPLCPNCHAMVHRRDPPLSVDELRKVLGKERKGEDDGARRSSVKE